MNNLTWHYFTERKPGRGVSSCTDAFYFFLLGLSVPVFDLLTKAVFCGGIVNRMHTAQGRLYNTTHSGSFSSTASRQLAHPAPSPLDERQQPCFESDSSLIDPDELYPSSLSHSSLPVRSSSSPSLLLFLILLLVILHLFWLWMPSSGTGWTQEGKEERVGWRTSGRNGRASFLSPYSWAAAWLSVTLWVCYC